MTYAKNILKHQDAFYKNVCERRIKMWNVFYNLNLLKTLQIGWLLGVAVTRFIRSMKLLYAGPD